MSDPRHARRVLLVSLGDAARPAANRYEEILGAACTVQPIDDAAQAGAALAAGDLEAAILVAAGKDRDPLIIDLLERAADRTPVAVLGVPAGPRARRMILAGAFLAIDKPTAPSLLDSVDQVLRYSRAIARQATYRLLPEDPFRLLGAGRAVQEAGRILRLAVASRSPVLVIGEAGSGKHIFARMLHQSLAEAGRKGRYVRCPLSAFEPPRLREALLGTASSPGAFEKAHGGTLFLDDISRLPPELQVTLLELITDGAAAKVRRTDDSARVPADVRIVAGSPPGLDEAVARGKVREDLYYRLGVLTIHLPPLRERYADIPVLVDSLVDHFAARAGKTILGPSPTAVDLLQVHDWPGTIRELETHIKNAVSRSRGPTLEAGHLSELAATLGVKVPGEKAGDADKGTLELSIALDEALPLADIARRASAAAEVVAIRRALDLTAGNVTRAARLLRVSRIHLQKRMKRYGLRDQTQ